MNSGTRGATKDLALDLAAATIDLWPGAVEPWRPETEPPAGIRAILGRWWSEGEEYVFTWKDGKLNADLRGAPAGAKPAVFEAVADGGYRVVSGRELGERLRSEGDRLIWGGYAFTRSQQPSPR